MWYLSTAMPMSKLYNDADDVIDNIDDAADDKGDKAGRCPKLCWSL